MNGNSRCSRVRYWPIASVRQRQPAAYTASFAAFTGRARTIFRAGLALNMVGSFVNGLMPFRALVAGFLMTTNFVKPGTRKTPDFLSSLWPTLTIHSMTAFTSFCPVRCPQRSSQSTEISSSALACCLLCSISQSIQTENSECPHLPFDARAEPLPELQELLLLALGLFLRGFLSHSVLIVLSRNTRHRYPSDAGTGVPAPTSRTHQ